MELFRRKYWDMGEVGDVEQVEVSKCGVVISRQEGDGSRGSGCLMKSCCSG